RQLVSRIELPRSQCGAGVDRPAHCIEHAAGQSVADRDLETVHEGLDRGIVRNAERAAVRRQYRLALVEAYHFRQNGLLVGPGNRADLADAEMSCGPDKRSGRPAHPSEAPEWTSLLQ